MRISFMAGFRRLVFMVIASVVLVACQAANTDEHPVFSFVRNNDAGRVGQYLAEAGDPNLKNGNGDSLLYVASGAKGGIDVVRLLLLGGADPDAISRQGRTALHTAAGWCNTDIVAALLESGARVDIKNDEGKLAIDVVCSQPRDRRDPVLALLRAAGS